MGAGTGFDSGIELAYTPARQNLVGSPYELPYAASDVSTAITAATLDIVVTANVAFTVTSVLVSLGTAQASGSIFTVDVRKNGVSLFSTLVTIDNTEYTNLTAAIPCVINNGSIAVGDRITTIVTQVGNGTAKQLGVSLIGTRA